MHTLETVDFVENHFTVGQTLWVVKSAAAQYLIGGSESDLITYAVKRSEKQLFSAD